MTQILTIAIPTYNRAPHLRFLLETLVADLAGSEDVTILISDNASTDDTEAVTSLVDPVAASSTVRNADNIGADGNIAQIFALVRTDYVWLMGDDDVPCAGAVAAVVSALKTHRPDLMALPSIWVADVRMQPRPSVDPAAYTVVDAVAFSRRVNVWVTFLSGIVINKARFDAACPPADATRYMGTNLVQLGWVLNTLKAGSTFICVNQPWVLATAGNSGGYAVLRTFAVDLARISEAVLGVGSPLAHAIISRTVLGYLPQLAWNVRYVDGARYVSEDAWGSIDDTLKKHLSYRLILRQIAHAPRPIANAALRLSRLLAAAMRRLDRLR